MVVFKRLVHGVVQVAVVDLVGRHPGRRLRQLAEFPPQVLPLLVRALRRGRQRGQFGVDLDEQLVQFAEIQRPAAVLVVLLEQPVEAAEVVRGLREAFLDPLGDLAPFGEGDLHLFRVFAFFDGERAEEGDEVVGHVVLHRGAVADGVDGAEGGAVEAQVGVGFQGVPIGLNLELFGDAFAEVGLRYKSDDKHPDINILASPGMTYRHRSTTNKSPVAILS